MKLRTIGAAAAATVALSAGAAAPAEAASGGCTARGAHTLAATKTVRVFAARNVVYACLIKGGRRYRLGVESDCQETTTAEDFRIAGRFVAYVTRSCNIDSFDSAAVVRNLRTGSRLTGSPPTGPVVAANSNTDVTDLEVTPRGSAVYIAEYDAEANGTISTTDDRREVRTLVTGGPEHGAPVDSGIDILASSLALGTRRTADGTPFYWRKGTSIGGGFVP